MNEDEVRKIARESAREAVRETFLMMGVDPSQPLEVQKDFQHVRSWRKATETAKRQSLITAIGILTAGVLGALWLFIKGPAS